jgi:hypothetical protein
MIENIFEMELIPGDYKTLENTMDTKNGQIRGLIHYIIEKKK